MGELLPKTDDHLDYLLALVMRTRKTEESPLWRTDPESACEEHGEACDALWRELHRLLDERIGTGTKVEAARPDRPELIKKALKRDMKKSLKQSLSSMVEQLVDDL